MCIRFLQTHYLQGASIATYAEDEIGRRHLINKVHGWMVVILVVFFLLAFPPSFPAYVVKCVVADKQKMWAFIMCANEEEKES